MLTRKRLHRLLLWVVLGGSACQPTRVPIMATPITVEPTAPPLPTATSAALLPTPFPTPTGLAETPTAFPADTPAPPYDATLPHLVAIVAVNVRAGPGTAYPILGQLAPGESAYVGGKTADGNWWLVVNGFLGDRAWVVADPALVTAQQIDAVPIAEADAAQGQPTLPQAWEATGNVRAFAFRADDRLLAVATDDQVQVWETEGWHLRWQADQSACQLIFTPDSNRLVSASASGLQIWEPDTGNPFATASPSGCGEMAVSANSRVLAYSHEQTGYALDPTDGKPLGEFAMPLPIFHLALAPDGPWVVLLATGSWGPVQVAVWDIFTHEQRLLFDAQVLPNFTNVSFSPDSRWLAASLAPSGPLRLWATRTWPEVTQLALPNHAFSRIAFSPDGRWLAAVAHDSSSGSILNQQVALWETTNWSLVTQIDQSDVTWQLAFSPNGQWLATSHGQGEGNIPPAQEARIWSVPGGQLRARLPHNAQVQAIAFSPQGRWVATRSGDGRLIVWGMD